MLQASKSPLDQQSSPTGGKVPVAVAHGDGIGPEIMDACLGILLEAGAEISTIPISIGDESSRSTGTAGIAAESWNCLKQAKVLYKAPITSPATGQGLRGQWESLLRKSLGLFANVRPCVSYAPFIATKHPGINAVVVRQVEEDLYGRVEGLRSGESYRCQELISRSACKQVARYAFDYARANHRRKVTCLTNDKLMKLTDDLFHRSFDEVASDYADIGNEHSGIDVSAARLIDDPEALDVIVVPNLHGDVLSDFAVQISGSVGLTPSADIGTQGAVFETIHGSAPHRAGQDLVNPTGLLLAGVMMLAHIGQSRVAERIHNAWLRTVEDGIHTYDVFQQGLSRKQVGTRAFAEAIVARLGQEPRTMRAISLTDPVQQAAPTPPGPQARKEIVGIDVFVQWQGSDTRTLAERMAQAANRSYSLAVITNRGVKVWPSGLPSGFCSDQWQCRYLAKQGKQFNHAMVVELLRNLTAQGVDFIKTEQLDSFDKRQEYALD